MQQKVSGDSVASLKILLHHMDVRRKIRFECPECKRHLASVDGMDAATQIVRRKCLHCDTRWLIKITPREIHGGFMDIANFVKI